MSGETESAADRFSAGAATLGFLYQLRFALAEALRRGTSQPDLMVRIEFLDDVDFTAPGSPVELVQSKHRIGAVADLQDSSVALWKTIRVWSTRIADGLAPDDVILTLVTTGHAPDGSAAACLRPGDARDPERAFERLMKIAEDSTNRETRQARRSFVELEETLRASLLRRVMVLDGAEGLPDLASAIEREVRRSCRNSQTGLFREHLEGWSLARSLHHASRCRSGRCHFLRRGRGSDRLATEPVSGRQPASGPVGHCG